MTDAALAAIAVGLAKVTYAYGSGKVWHYLLSELPQVLVDCDRLLAEVRRLRGLVELATKALAAAIRNLGD